MTKPKAKQMQSPSQGKAKPTPSQGNSKGKPRPSNSQANAKHNPRPSQGQAKAMLRTGALKANPPPVGVGLYLKGVPPTLRVRHTNVNWT